MTRELLLVCILLSIHIVSTGRVFEFAPPATGGNVSFAYSQCFCAIAGWKTRCAEYFTYSTYFEGSRSSSVTRNANKHTDASSENGLADSHSLIGKLQAFHDLKIQ